MEDEIYKKAKERVNEIKNFYKHLTVYIVINVIFIYFVGKSWLWVTAFWGMGVVFHFVNTFLFSKEWEEKKIRDYMNKEKSSNKTKEDSKKEDNIS